MDIFSSLGGLLFVWSSEKAAANYAKHKVHFENAREVFLDILADYEEAGPENEARLACIGRTLDNDLLYVVHVDREEDVLRLISARQVSPAERRRHEDD